MFFYQQPGTGAGAADYIVGNDVVTPGGIRSMRDPPSFGDPDNYSIRYTGAEDNGGVHINSGIASHAFYLAIEGGTNRTSGLSVQGVGAANREQMGKVFYRAFTQLLPANAKGRSPPLGPPPCRRHRISSGRTALSSAPWSRPQQPVCGTVRHLHNATYLHPPPGGALAIRNRTKAEGKKKKKKKAEN